MRITRLLHFSLFSWWNSQPIPSFAWPSLTHLHHSTGFIIGLPAAPGNHLGSLTASSTPLVHHNSNSTSRQSSKKFKALEQKLKSHKKTSRDILKIQLVSKIALSKEVYCLELSRLCTKSNSKMMILSCTYAQDCVLTQTAPQGLSCCCP